MRDDDRSVLKAHALGRELQCDPLRQKGNRAGFVELQHISDVLNDVLTREHVVHMGGPLLFNLLLNRGNLNLFPRLFGLRRLFGAQPFRLADGLGPSLVCCSHLLPDFVGSRVFLKTLRDTRNPGTKAAARQNAIQIASRDGSTRYRETALRGDHWIGRD